jgi:hypothetical protein
MPVLTTTGSFSARATGFFSRGQAQLLPANEILAQSTLWISPALQLSGVPNGTSLGSLTNYGIGGQTLTQGTGSAQPTKQSSGTGIPVVRSTEVGASRMLINPGISISSGTNLTLAIVTQVFGNRAIGFGGNDSTFWGLGPNLVLFRDGVDGGVTYASPVTFTSTLNAIVLVKTGNNCDIYINTNVLRTTATASGSFNFNWFSFRATAGQYSDASFGDIAYIPRAINSGEITSVMNYLVSTYGIIP